jgi:hypothetical protein
MTVIRQGEPKTERAIAGECADFDIAPGIHQSRRHCHERPLFRRNLHNRDPAHGGRLLAAGFQYGVLAHANIDGIVENGVAKIDGFAHGISSS